MRTYNRICIKDVEVVDGKKRLKLKRGQEYCTSEEKDGLVVVFTSYWATVPVEWFAGEQVFTEK